MAVNVNQGVVDFAAYKFGHNKALLSLTIVRWDVLAIARPPQSWSLCSNKRIQMESYLEIKRDVKSLVEETVSMGNHIQGGLGRACDEYWLDSLHLNQHGPSFLTKFMAIMSILKMYVDNGLDHNHELKETAMYLVAKLTERDIKNINDKCIKEILRDSKDIYEFNWYIIHSCFKQNA